MVYLFVVVVVASFIHFHSNFPPFCTCIGGSFDYEKHPVSDAPFTPSVKPIDMISNIHFRNSLFPSYINIRTVH